jgi:hypothetical protein
MLLGLKPYHTCDVISVAAECMVGVAGVEVRPYVRSISTPFWRLLFITVALTPACLLYHRCPRACVAILKVTVALTPASQY